MAKHGLYFLLVWIIEMEINKEICVHKNKNNNNNNNNWFQ